MPSERVQRQIDRLLDEADEAAVRHDWQTVRDRANAALAFDPDNADASAYLAAADRGAQAAGVTEPTASPSATPNTQPLALTSFANGRYAVKRFLGEGGKKKVYLAHDSLLDRDVAFALIKTEGLDEAARERITREAQAMGRLGAHPHIVTVFDIGEEDRQPYLVLPVLAGGDVEGVIEKAPEHKLPLEQAIRIAVETCQGLEFVHGKGIVHRDLKPGNVWLTEDGRAMIGDFGLAVAMDRTRLTQAGMMVGTVSYMPPEQAMGGEITPRSDLYALGAMLYEMVCGRPPFVGDESVAIIGQHLNTPPVAPSWHRPDCPPALETLILRLLEKDPEKRPQRAAEVREALHSVAQSGGRPPTQAPEPIASPHIHDPLYRTVFVGREAELRQLQQAYDAAVSGQGGLVMVVGEPGIGKTALCEQLATYVSIRGGRTLVGHCYEEGSLSLPYLAFVEAMRTYVLARDPDGLKSDLGSGAADLARIVSEVRDRVQVQLRDAGDPEDDRWRLLQSVTTFLRNAASVQPLVIVLEDLHWADRGTLDLLLHVSRNLQGARLLVVGTYRDVEVDRTHPLSGTLGDLRRINTFLRVPLRGLTAEEVQRMMAAVARQDIPWPFAELLHRQTEGNPLFVQEMLRFLVEEGLVSQQEGQLRRVGEESLAGRVPEGLRDVIGRRLSRLSPECNRVLAIASVIGRDFRLDTLTAVSGLDEDALVTALEEATRIGVLEEQARAGAVGYRFTHAFFRQTLYEELSAPRRIRMHQQVARALEETYARRLEEHAAELAEHYSNSSDATDLVKAVMYAEAAAQRALTVFDYGEGARLLERAIDVQEVLGDGDVAKRCDLLLLYGEALVALGDARRVAGQISEVAFRVAQETKDDERAARACALALDALFRYGAAVISATDTYKVWAERSDRVAKEGTLSRIQADIALSRLGARDLFTDFVKSNAYRLRALALARELGDPLVLYQTADSILANFGTPNEVSLPLANEFLAVSREGLPDRLVASLIWNAMRILLSNGERDQIPALYEEASRLTSRTRDAVLALFGPRLDTVLATLDGRLEDAIAAGQHVIALGEQIGRPVAGRQYGTQDAMRARVWLGRTEEALRSFEAIGQNLDEPVQENRVVSSYRSTLLAYCGRETEARDILSALAGRVELGLPSFVTSALLETALILNDDDALGQIMPVGELHTGVVPFWITFCSIDRLLGEGSSRLGKQEEARSHFMKALKVCRSLSYRPETALIRLDLAELLLEHYPDEREAAIEHLDFAIAELRDMKMQPALERALRHRGLLKA